MFKAAVVSLVLATSAAGSASGVAAQATSEADAESLAAIERLSFIIGEWSGTSTSRMGPGTESSSVVSERATLLAGGAALLLEGRGTNEEQGRTRVIHEAVAIVTWDPDSSTYVMRAFRAGQGWTDSELELDGKTLAWGMETPAGRVRFTLDFSEDGRWREIGEIERAGRWYRFLEMDLTRARP